MKNLDNRSMKGFTENQKGPFMQVIKRSGEIVEFDPEKIYQAILKAAQTVYVIDETWRKNLAQVT